jgi:hypothetical protein
MRNMYKILVGKPEWKRVPEKFSRTWKNNIKADRTEIWHEEME